MGLIDILIIAVVAGILGLDGWYIHRGKKAGRKCIGCPSGTCSHTGCGGNCSGCSGCGTQK